jgi:membrane protein
MARPLPPAGGMLLRRIAQGALEHNITGEAAKAAFYFFLALFPMILLIFALTGLFGGDAAFRWIMGFLQGHLPAEGEAWVAGFVRQVTQDGRPDMFSVGLLLAVWAGSNFFAALGDGLNRMWGVREPGPWWRRRIKAIGMLLAGSVLLVGGTLLILLGPAVVAWLGLSPVAALVRWPLVFVLIVAQLYLLYYVMPDRDQSNSKRELLVGALAGAVLWLLAIGLFQLYISRIAEPENLYGIVGSVIVLLLWLFLSAITILLGGEIAEVLEERRRGH